MENRNFALNYLNLYCLILYNFLVPIMYLQNMTDILVAYSFDVDISLKCL